MADSKTLCRVFAVAFPPLVPYGTTFPPLCGGTIKLRITFHSYVALK